MPGAFNCFLLFRTRQVRVVRFYVSLLLLLFVLLLRLLLRRLAVSSEPRPSALCVPCRSQPRSSALSVPCRTSTATICAQCSLPDLNHDHLRAVFPAGPQPRPSALSVPCRTSPAR